MLDAAVYRGHEGLREYLTLMREMWKQVRFEPQEFIPVGEDKVVVPVRMIAVGRAEIETVARGATVFTVREGKVTHMKAFQSKAEALEAAGVRE
jgi:ketosteroid isomerase-like protein